MSNQFQVRRGITINPVAGTPGSIVYRSPGPTVIQGTMNGNNGPTPGTIKVTHAPGTIVNFSELDALGGLCDLINYDQVNSVEYGIWVPALNLFLPLGLILPGEAYTIRLSANLGGEEPGTGTGSFGSTNFMLRSPTGTTVIVYVGAFDP